MVWLLPKPVGPVHPHACGEHLSRGIEFEPPSVHPHACGEHMPMIEADNGYVRFIPTPVGNTCDELSSELGCAGSSPRLWGTLPEMFAPARTGSSPRLWGTHSVRRRCRRRFIPTPVGNTGRCLSRRWFHSGSSPRLWGTLPWSSAAWQRDPVHPHACGEHTSSNPPGSQHLLDCEIATG